MSVTNAPSQIIGGCGNYSPASITRYRFRQWWKEHRTVGKKIPVVGVYNAGRHLYLDDQRVPGFFLRSPQIPAWNGDPPTILKTWFHREGIIRVNGLSLAHHGHLYGTNGGTATITAFNQFGLMLRVEIEPFWMTYVLQKDDGSIHSIKGWMPLPQDILPRLFC